MTTATKLAAKEVQVSPTLAVQLAMTSDAKPEAIGAAMTAAFAALEEYLRSNAITPSGPPRALYTTFGPGGTSFTLAFPIAAPPEAVHASTGITIGTLPGGRMVRFEHHGPYDRLHATYDRIEAWLRQHDLITSDHDWSRFSPMWEEYVRQDEDAPPFQLLTYIYLPLGA